MSPRSNVRRAEPYICAALSGFVSLGGAVDPEKVANASIAVGLAVAEKLVALEEAAEAEEEAAETSLSSPELSASPSPAYGSLGPPGGGAGQAAESSAPPVAPEAKPPAEPIAQISHPPPGKGNAHQSRPR